MFVSVLKELNKPKDQRGKATLVLSTMSNDFEDFKTRVEKSGVFESVIEFDEKRDTYFPELERYRTDKGNIVVNMINRIIFTKRFAKLEAPFVPVDFKKYDDIYVFCDADPIGLYLNQNRIRYHAMEDGLDTLSHCVEAIYDNRSHFALKKFMSKTLNLIFIRDGYSKYCIDMEVNDRSVIDDDFDGYVEVNRNELLKALSSEERNILIRMFIRDYDSFSKFLDKQSSDGVLILTEPLCSLDIREKIFRDIIDTYRSEGTIFIKPHPRDVLDYEKVFSDYWVFDRTIPMEILTLFDNVHFKKIVSVYTILNMMDIADEKVMLGDDFMDKYEDPAIHRKKESIHSA